MGVAVKCYYEISQRDPTTLHTNGTLAWGEMHGEKCKCKAEGRGSHFGEELLKFECSLSSHISTISHLGLSETGLTSHWTVRATVNFS